MRNADKILMGKLQRKYNWEEEEVDGKILEK
jgi:hypothetical protein